MLDILQSIDRETRHDHDPHGFLSGLDRWSPSLAEKMALNEGLELGKEHWEVIHLLRDHYRFHGPTDIHNLKEGLEERFMLKGGMKHLYQLFPLGPISQGYRLAGLPAPANTADRSFGTVH
jgi:tRNA 2-thiouridine synthesizing protein E